MTLQNAIAACVATFITGFLIGAILIGSFFYYREHVRRQEAQQLLDLIQKPRK